MGKTSWVGDVMTRRLKSTWGATGVSFLSFSKALCVCQSRICPVSLFTVVCQRKIGNKKEREKEKTRKHTYQRHIMNECLAHIRAKVSRWSRLPAL